MVAADPPSMLPMDTHQNVDNDASTNRRFIGEVKRKIKTLLVPKPPEEDEGCSAGT